MPMTAWSSDAIPPVSVEACVDSVESALAAQAGGASRVELCDNLLSGGTTPSAGMVETCCERLGIPVFVIVRPRAGDFLYSPDEVEVMRRDIVHAARVGAGGVVLGLLHADGTVDVERTRSLIAEARPMAVTFHRAFDVSRGADEALDALMEVGVDRVLTSGRAATAEVGIPVISRMVRRSAGRIGVLPGGGVKEANVRRIVDETGVREVHVRVTSLRQSPMEYRHPEVTFGGRKALPDELLEVTEAAGVAQIVHLVNDAGPTAPNRVSGR